MRPSALFHQRLDDPRVSLYRAIFRWRAAPRASPITRPQPDAPPPPDTPPPSTTAQGSHPPSPPPSEKIPDTGGWAIHADAEPPGRSALCAALFGGYCKPRNDIPGDVSSLRPVRVVPAMFVPEPTRRDATAGAAMSVNVLRARASSRACGGGMKSPTASPPLPPRAPRSPPSQPCLTPRARRAPRPASLLPLRLLGPPAGALLLVYRKDMPIRVWNSTRVGMLCPFSGCAWCGVAVVSSSFSLRSCSSLTRCLAVSRAPRSRLPRGCGAGVGIGFGSAHFPRSLTVLRVSRFAWTRLIRVSSCRRPGACAGLAGEQGRGVRAVDG